MAGQSFNIKVNVGDGGDIERIKRALAGLGATVTNTGRVTKAANKDSAELHRTQNQGIIGTANSTKSFSKLAQTIGNDGSSGLVGAYATLAANIFAVTAAFGALRGAAQVEQVLRGLEAAGIRTGLSLTSTAKALKDVTGSAISAEEALRATAMVTSAGFNDEFVKRLGVAARDTSFALGRNMTDTIDRLTRGIVKLEPELLDELGIFTKITESNAKYAAQLGKSESQLSSYEKRVGFANAALTELELKFGGLAAQAGNATAFDRLAATFSDLTKSIFGFINIIAKPIVSVFADSATALLGVMLLFGASLKNQLIPALANTSVRAAAAAESYKKLSAESLAAARASRVQAADQFKANLRTQTTFDYLGKTAPARYKTFRDAIKAGTADAKVQDAAIASLTKSLATHERQLAALPAGTQRDVKVGKIAAVEQERAAIVKLIETQKRSEVEAVAGSETVKKARKDANVAILTGRSAQASANSLEAASQFRVIESYTQLRKSVSDYSKAQAIASAEGLTGMDRLRIASFAAGGAVKALGTAFLAALPYIGLITIAFGLLKSAYESFKSDEVKNLEKAYAALSETLKNANKQGDELVRISNSQASASQRAAAALTLQGNAAREAAEKFSEYRKAFEEANGESIDQMVNRGRGSIAAWYNLGTESVLSYELGLKKGTDTLKIAEVFQKALASGNNKSGNLTSISEPQKAFLALYNSLEQANKKSLDEAVKAKGGLQNILKTVAELNQAELVKFGEEIANNVTGKIGSAAEAVKSFQEAQKVFNDTVGEFSRASIIKTPFDDLVRDSQTLLVTMGELREVATSNELTQLLSGLDERSKSVLSAETGQRISDYLKADATIQAQINGLKEIGVNLGVDELYYAKERLAVESNLGSIILDEFANRVKLFRQNQEQDRLYKSQLDLLNAQVSANSKIYAMGGAGRLAQIKAEERIREIKKAQLANQIDMHKLLIAQTEAAIAQIKNKRIELELNNNLNDALAKTLQMDQERAAINAYRQQYGTELNTNALKAGTLDTSNVTGNALQSIENYNTTLKTLEDVEKRKKEALELGKQEVALTQQVQDHLDSIKALSTQIAAINAENLTKEQKLEQIREAQAQLNGETLKLIDATLDKNKELLNINNEIYGIVNNVTNRMDFQLEIIKKTAASQKEVAEKTFKDAQKTYEQAKRTAEAEKTRTGLSKELRDAVDSAVQAQQNNLDVLEKQLNIDLQIIEARERQAILEKVMFDTHSQGLEWQRDALSAIQKQLDAERELGDQVRKTGELRVALAAKRAGYEISPLGQSALEINAAKDSLDFAIRESEVKKSLIDLEFALLAAQRDNLEFELQTRKTALEGQNSNGQFNTQIAQLDRVLANLPSSDTILRGAELQKDLFDRNIKNLRLSLEIATTLDRKNPGSAIAGALAGLVQYQEARKGASRADPDPIKVGSAIIDTAVRKTTEQIAAELRLQSENTPIGANTKALIELRDVINKWILSNPTSTVNASGILNKNIYDAAKDADAFANSLAKQLNLSKYSDFGATELQGYGRGVKYDHKGHNSNAFDLNVRAGTGELRDPRIKAAFDAKAKYFQSQGFLVLWNGKKYNPDGSIEAIKDHFDHMHVQMTNQVGRVASTAINNLEQSIPKAVAQAVNDNPTAVNSEANNPITVMGGKLENSLQKSMPNKGVDFGWTDEARAKILTLVEGTRTFDEALSALGPEGEAVVAIKSGLMATSMAVLDCIDKFEYASTSSEKFQAIAAVASAAVSVISTALAASADAKIANIDREIAAEQRRDGKSAESVAKIEAMEKKKDAIARKQFNTNKKLMMAQAIIATAAGVAQALSYGPLGIPLAVLIGALGAAQLAIIAGTQYQSTTSGAKTAAAMPRLTIGKRGDTVDLAKQNNNVGGELGYLRGAQGAGSNSANYSVVGSAYGGNLPRGYGNAGFIVGEKGPERIFPEVPMTVRPNNDNDMSRPIDATFNIQAFDASGVEDMLQNQKGNIISMLRDAANSNGSGFMENVNVSVYSRPNKANRL